MNTWKRGTSEVVGPYTVRQEQSGGWYVTLTATGETLRGPLDYAYMAREAAERYTRLTASLGGEAQTMNRNDYGRHVSHWFEYAAQCLQSVGPHEHRLAVWEAFGGMRTDTLDTTGDEALRASIRGRLLALEAWKARNGYDTPSLPALREGRDD